MIRLAGMLVLLAATAFGQLTLAVVDGTTETVLAPNALLQLRPTESGDTQTVRLRIRNQGSRDEQVTQFVAEGTGFVLQRPLPPVNLAAGAILNATLVFTAGAPANYSASLRMNGTTVLVLASVTAGPVLTMDPLCVGTSANTMDFGSVARGNVKTCGATLTNPGSQPMTISTLSATGAGFSVTQYPVPFTLAPGQSVPLLVQLNATASGQVSGMLQVQGRSYTLSAIVFNGPLPKPVLEFDSVGLGSAQQRRITVKLAAPAGASASGFLDLAFQPDATGIADDPAVLFVESGTRQVRFSVAAGQTAVTLNGRDAVTLQTGTSAGRLRFSFSGYAPGFAEDPTVTMTVPAAPVILDRITASKSPERLDVTMTGFDNSYSMGAMTFRFYDGAGSLIGQPVTADFSAAFRTFFTGGPGGSAFRVTVTFPAKNNAGVAAVEAELSNAAGTLRTSRQSF